MAKQKSKPVAKSDFVGIHVVPVAASKQASVRARPSKSRVHSHQEITTEAPPNATHKSSKRPNLSILHAFGALYSWALWVFLMILVTSQILMIISNISTHAMDVTIGISPSLGMHTIAGSDDTPYTDRAVACVLEKRRYSPKQLYLALKKGVTASSIDGYQNGVNGYRVVPRAGSQLTNTGEAKTSYATMCNLMAATVDVILDACESLGYNVTRDGLRVVSGTDRTQPMFLPESLPVLILPFHDNLPYAKFAVPGWDGSACVFRLEGADVTNVANSAGDVVFYLIGASRVVRESFVSTHVMKQTRTSSGTWQNGWYHPDDTSSKWFGDAISTSQVAEAGIFAPQRQFKLEGTTVAELDCTTSPSPCVPITYEESWSAPQIDMKTAVQEFTMASVANGSQFGVAYSHHAGKTQITYQYTLAALISAISMLAALLRWGAALSALHISHFVHRRIPYYSAGIGVLSCSRSFNFVPILMLPRLRVLLVIFASLGLGGNAARQAGDQLALVDAWFVIYPAIVEMVLYFYCLLNWVGILFKRRTTDVLFGPSVIVFCFIHYFRNATSSMWYDSSAPFQSIESADVETLSVFDLLAPETLLRFNGGGSKSVGIGLFVFKLALLFANAAPMLISSRHTSFQSRSREQSSKNTTETWLAFSPSKLGGLGISDLYERNISPPGKNEPEPKRQHVLVSGYEVARLGYIVVGGKYLVGISAWYKLLLLSPMRLVRNPTNIRVVVFAISTSEVKKGIAIVHGGPIIVRVNDSRLCSVNLTDISLATFG